MLAILVFLLIVVAAWLYEQNAGGFQTMTNPEPQPPGPSEAMTAFAGAIRQAEGSDPSWNNPGDLTLSFGYPTTGTANSAGVLIFQNASDGWNALYDQLTRIVNRTSNVYDIDSDTIATMGMKYSGGDPNWAVNVANYLGVDVNTPLNQVLS